MSVKNITYQETGYFSKIIVDYLSQDKKLSQFYNQFPAIENFKVQIENKQKSFSSEARNRLVTQLTLQNSEIDLSEATVKNIEKLSDKNTFTVTTGHQLNLFSGPLYFLYKIFSTINLAEKLNKTYPKNHFVPIYWMATEDHDFEEINYFNFKGKKIHWNRKDGGAVGMLSTEGLDAVLKSFENEIGSSENAKKLTSLFEKSYLKHSTLTEATRYFANSLFSEYGLVLLDGNDTVLKSAFIPYVEKELYENLSFKKTTETTDNLIKLGYPAQVHPREINLFYLNDGLRERIVKKDSRYFVNESAISFSLEEIKEELHKHPERFSPNALLRPLYEEVVLPNLCYIGGGGELAYWFQLKSYFDEVGVVFPILLLRNSALLVDDKLSEKVDKLAISVADLFQKQEVLTTQFTKQLSEIEIDFSPQREQLQQQFKGMYDLAKKTDASFIGAVGAQEQKQINGLHYLEKRLLKAQKRKLADQLDRLILIQDTLFPNQSLQERNTNFSEFYLEYGEALLQKIKENLDPLNPDFTIITF